MANGKGGNAGRAAQKTGRVAQRLAPILASAISMQSAQQQDRRYEQEIQNVLGSDTALSDESLGFGDEVRPSVLDPGAPTRGYTQSQVPDIEAPIAGGGMMEEPAMELMRMREKEERMRQSQTQFLGKEPAPSAPKTPSAPPSAQRMERGAPSPEEEEEEAMEMEQIQAIETEQLQQQARQQATKQIKQRFMDQMAAKRSQRAAVRAQRTAARLSFEGSNVSGTVPSIGITLLVLIAQLNVQMIMKYIFVPMLFKGSGETIESMVEGQAWLDQSFVEDVITVAIDIALTCVGLCCNPCCLPFTGIALLYAAIPHDFESALQAVGNAVTR